MLKKQTSSKELLTTHCVKQRKKHAKRKSKHVKVPAVFSRMTDTFTNVK